MTSRDRRRSKLLEAELDRYEKAILETGKLFSDGIEALEVFFAGNDHPALEPLRVFLRAQAKVAAQMIEMAERGWRANPDLWPPRQ